MTEPKPYFDAPRDELVAVNGFKHIAVSRNKRVYNRALDKDVIVHATKHGSSPFVHLMVNNNERQIKLALLLLAAFMPAPVPLVSFQALELLEVLYLDGDKRNLELDNLRWKVRPNIDFLLTEEAGEDQLLPVPSVPGVLVNRNVLCYNETTGNIMTPWVDTSCGNLYVRYRNLMGEDKCLVVKRLIAEVFLPPPAGPITNYTVVSLNGDYGDCSPNNLKWGDPNEINYLHLLDKPATPDLKLYQVPSIPNLAINRLGHVYNLNTGNLLKNQLYSTGYLLIHSMHKGVSLQESVHRLIGEVFVPPKDGYTIEECVKVLQINHKNFDKQDYSPDNLEWVTSQENMIHAFEEQDHGSAIKITINNLLTNESKVVRSISEAIRQTSTAWGLVVHAYRFGVLERMQFKDYVLSASGGFELPKELWAFHYKGVFEFKATLDDARLVLPRILRNADRNMLEDGSVPEFLGWSMERA